MQYSLKELRARVNMTQAEIAQKLGVSTQTYCGWENSPGDIKISKAVQLAKIFGIQVGDIKIN